MFAKSECPNCALVIPAGARKCHHCHSELGPVPIGKRLLPAREYVTLLAAALALIVSLYNLTFERFLRLFRLDGAHINAFYFADTTQLGRIDLFRLTISNRGYSRASISTTFACGGPEIGEDRIIYAFRTFDPEKGANVFIGIDQHSSLELFGDLWSVGCIYKDRIVENECEIGFIDKYGNGTFRIKVDEQSLNAIYSTYRSKQSNFTLPCALDSKANDGP